MIHKNRPHYKEVLTFAASSHMTDIAPMVLVVKSVADDLTQCARPLVIIVQENYT